jgi:hypothetical protein
MSNTDEQQEKTTSKKKRGRPKNENYLPWNDARDFIRSELIPSRGKFFEWHDRFPYRVYKEWVSWNDFLGTDNKFNEKVGTKWRQLDEATVWVHRLKLTSQAQWMDWCREEGNLPEDVPARPDLVYEKWRSWNHWLGNKPAEAVEAKQQAQRNVVYYIVHEADVPANVFTYGTEAGGLSALKERWEREHFDICRLFWFDHNRANAVKQIVEGLSRPYMGEARQRITPNVWEIVSYLEVHLETIRLGRHPIKQSKPEDNTWEFDWGKP